MKFFTVLIAAVSAVLVLGCSNISVTTDYDREFNFKQLKSFEWLGMAKNSTSANAETAMLQNGLIDKRVRATVKSQLEAKGLKENPDSADFFIMYHAGTEKKVNVTDYGYGYGYGYGGRWGGGGVDVQQYTQGTLILDFVDPKTKTLLWRSVATGALSSTPDPSTADQKVHDVVSQMLSDFPPAGSKSK
ncbi:MAG TPA: DUF4136 domain-containing protein [Bacteroidota bacterium]|nr:DUF4136 domain-containing protein [Bacteroidota bacterium]